ncbi:hypothetical protein K227x_49650 [Rubripirellula lacrimiformis]|uniref:Uncharacterized protein n=1 Tax=Rubripirellula lacrimiformis TaxID=1930273 RepID=A0A517NHD9_9BACT|nr:hypothetical protein K227x_49650 [Rubripirellula lacrimiformis]
MPHSPYAWAVKGLVLPRIWLVQVSFGANFVAVRLGGRPIGVVSRASNAGSLAAEQRQPFAGGPRPPATGATRSKREPSSRAWNCRQRRRFQAGEEGRRRHRRPRLPAEGCRHYVARKIKLEHAINCSSQLPLVTPKIDSVGPGASGKDSLVCVPFKRNKSMAMAMRTNPNF